MFELMIGDNLEVDFANNCADLIYGDCIYESTDFRWCDKYWNVLKRGGIFQVQTDYHTVAEIKVYINALPDAYLVNWLTWKNEFGNFKKDRFRQCHDDILIFSKGKDFYFDGNKVQVDKVTAKSRGLNPSGRTTKLATSVITDICLTTISPERIKLGDTCVRWQKPIALLTRLFSGFVVPGNLIIDPFMGTCTSGVVAKKLGCEYIGIENDPQIFQLAKARIDGLL